MGKKFDAKLDNFIAKIFGNSNDKQAPIQSYIPIEYIKDKIVKLKNCNEYRILINVNAVNFFTKTYEEKAAIVRQFGVFLDSTKLSMQIVTQSKTLNMKETLVELKDKYNKCDNPYTKEYIAIYGNLLNGLAEDSNVLTKDFFLVLKYSASPEETFLSISKNFTLAAQRATSSLDGCGIKSNVLNDSEIYQLLYLFYNKDKSKFQSISDSNLNSYMSTALLVKKEQQAESKYNFDFMDYNRPGGTVNYLDYHKDIPITDVLDSGIVTVEDILSADDIIIEKDHLVINNRYVRTIFISGILREECYPEWMSDIYTYPANIDISLHITPIRKKDALDELTKKYNYQMANLQEAYQKGKTLDEREKMMLLN